MLPRVIIAATYQRKRTEGTAIGEVMGLMYKITSRSMATRVTKRKRSEIDLTISMNKTTNYFRTPLASQRKWKREIWKC